MLGGWNLETYLFVEFWKMYPHEQSSKEHNILLPPVPPTDTIKEVKNWVHPLTKAELQISRWSQILDN